MITVNKYQFSNGLRLLHHTDCNTRMVAINLLYDVGARDESPDCTGFAHLFEHLMFGGSLHIPDFDTALQKAGGENNAWTSNDITNYYTIVPRQNVETAFWLESDRMLGLDFSQHSLDVQKAVVIEEFKQRTLNQPYGDIPAVIRELAYREHPYRWPVIGRDISSIDASITGDIDAGLFLINGRLNPGISLQQADEAIEEELNQLCREPASEQEISKMVHKFETGYLFSNLSYVDKAANLSYFELIDAAESIDREVEKYYSITPESLQKTAQAVFRANNMSTLYYKARNSC